MFLECWIGYMSSAFPFHLSLGPSLCLSLGLLFEYVAMYR